MLLMSRNIFALAILLLWFNASHGTPSDPESWIRINQLGYRPGSPKVAVWCSMWDEHLNKFELVDLKSNTVVFIGKPGKGYGSYGPFVQSYRLDFSGFKKP